MTGCTYPAAEWCISCTTLFLPVPSVNAVLDFCRTIFHSVNGDFQRRKEFFTTFSGEHISMHIEERIHITVPPLVIDRIWSEVDQWHCWDPDTKQAVLDGPFAVGTKGRITPRKGLGVPMIITERTEGRSFTVEGHIPLFRMHFEHTVLAIAGGSEVAHRVWFTGALAFLFGPGVAKQLREGLPQTMQSLKAYAEKRHSQTRAEA